ncbi:MAG: YdcF family protein [Rhizobiaceae bacterium]
MPDIEYPNSTKKPSLGRRAARGTGRAGSWLFRFVMKLLLVTLFIAAGLFIGGFLQFTNKVADAVQPASIEPADAIVALTGGSTRIATALELLQQKKGARLLISGVNEDTLKSDIAAMHSDKADLFECCVDVERVAVDTIGNARETASWSATNGYKSLIIVTSAYHMPRSMLEFRRQMDGLKLVPYPVPLDSINKEEWWKNATTLRFMVNEYLKYLGARARDYVQPQTFDALRGNMFGAKEI